MDADRFDRLAKSLVRSESSLARGADRFRLSSIAGAAIGRRHALKIGTGLVLGGALRILGPGDAAQAIDDAQCPAPAGPCCAGFGRPLFAQTFKAKHTGLLTEATLQLSGGSDSAINSYLIEIRTTRKGKPTTEVLDSFQTAAFDRPPTGQTTPVVATFASAPVKKKKVYALVLTETGGSPMVQLNLDGCGGTLFDGDEPGRQVRQSPRGQRHGLLHGGHDLGTAPAR